jgi:hypothetical protein
VTKEAGKGRFGEILGRDARDQNSAGLSSGGMGGANKEALANFNIMAHLMFDIPPNPYCGRKTSGIIAGRLSRYLTREYPGEQ